MSLKEKQQSQLKIAISPLKLFKDSHNPPKIIEILNHAIADEAVLSMKTRNAKWNLFRDGFSDLCNIYEIHLNQINEITVEIVERTKMLHFTPIGSILDILDNSRLSETPGVVPDAFQLLTDHESIIRFFREDYRDCKNNCEEICTSEVLIKSIRLHEKMAWMLRSFTNNEKVIDDFSEII